MPDKDTQQITALAEAGAELEAMIDSVVEFAQTGSRINLFRRAEQRGSPEAMNVTVSRAVEGKRPLAGIALSVIRTELNKMGDKKSFEDLISRHSALVKLAESKRKLDPLVSREELRNAAVDSANGDISAYEKYAADPDLAFPAIALFISILATFDQEDASAVACRDMINELCKTEIPALLDLNFSRKMPRLFFIYRNRWLKAYELLLSNPFVMRCYLHLVKKICWEPPRLKGDASRFYVYVGEALTQVEFQLAR